MFKFLKNLFKKEEHTHAYDIKLVEEIQEYIVCFESMGNKSVSNYKKLNKDVNEFKMRYEEINHTNKLHCMDSYYGATPPMRYYDYYKIETFKAFCKELHNKLYKTLKDTDEFIDMMAEKEKAANTYGDYRVIRAINNSYKLEENVKKVTKE